MILQEVAPIPVTNKEEDKEKIELTELLLTKLNFSLGPYSVISLLFVFTFRISPLDVPA